MRLERVQAAELAAIAGELAQAQAILWTRLHTPASAPPVEETADYTADGLATQFKLSKGTVYRLFRAGVWPNAYRLGRTKGLRVPCRDVEVWRAAKVERPRFELISRKGR